MKAERSYPKITVSKKAEASIVNGHPWIYAEELISGEEGIPNGELVDAVSTRGAYLGTGFLSKNSKIRIRLLSRNANDRFDEAFWIRRLNYAWKYRKTVMGDDISCCRIVFGEADGLPGLTVDRFSDLLVVQCLSYGMEHRKDVLYPELIRLLREDGQIIRGLYERNDNALRGKEGLPEGKGWYRILGDPDPGATVTTIIENDIQYFVDVENGQKTGFFLDQKYNRLAVSSLVRDMRVLDCFTHTGSFALNAAKGGAKSVLAIDISDKAISVARENAVLNHLEDRISFQTSDVFDYLTQTALSGIKPFDFIILDPPAFTKSRKTASSAERGYKEINYRAMKLLPRGGYLATASCSHFMSAYMFEEMLLSAAKDANVSLRQVEARQQSPDHPILKTVPETEYLKFYIFQII
ncbi:MAG: class I SAM-dependent rRNA methyltransferase [Oscillospiraceae bacterium]|nr:class I SAM-dependent rRNA methyltransferase [Oscillospiraceae bacterium]